MQDISPEVPIRKALDILAPAWPLQNIVAVNPFWNLRSRHFTEVLLGLESTLHQSLLMPTDFFREKYESGEISDQALTDALEQARRDWPTLPKSLPELLRVSSLKAYSCRKIKTIAEITANDLDLQELVIGEIGKFAAAYFDQNQAMIRFPWRHLSFWEAWHKAQSLDQAMTISGFSDFVEGAQQFCTMTPEHAIEYILKELNISSNAGRHLYLQRSIVSLIGWGSQFYYWEWQKNLDYQVDYAAKAVELLAVRVVYDYLIYKQCLSENRTIYQQWSETISKANFSTAVRDEYFALQYTWQLAFELSYQRQVATRLQKTLNKETATPNFSLIFCIDVRSEMIRRHIEALGDDCHTRGFAGFFAAAIDYQKSNERSVSHRLPVLLKPAISMDETSNRADNIAKSSDSIQVATLVGSYFRNMRKAPLSSFLFVELFGILSIAKLAARSVSSIYRRYRHIGMPLRFEITNPQEAMDRAANHATKEILSSDERLAFAANALKHMGLTEKFAKLTLVVGHGAETANNAFASGLDCGACGGHAGDLNARFLVKLLNSPVVRSGLMRHNIVIPENCWFVAAIHETVTDTIHIFEEEKIPNSFAHDLAHLKVRLQSATQTCRKERQTARSNCLDDSAIKRSANWSEVRPEWGLSGNACFIVAPRQRSKNSDLGSRAFLHDYDWRSDTDFQTLELIMTAPMIVTNWINMQYFASVVAPRYYGSGNKVLHNLIGETGVVEGNGGDLRVGLPLQSVHDGKKFVHDPLRLSVFIEAPRVEIEKIIAKHAIVSDLVINEWLHIIAIDHETGLTWRRYGDGTYAELLPAE